MTWVISVAQGKAREARTSPPARKVRRWKARKRCACGRERAGTVVVVIASDHLVGDSPVSSTGALSEGLDVVHARGVGREQELVLRNQHR